ncbi:hypothetical protein M513_00383, partial [Trichuris suis]
LTSDFTVEQADYAPVAADKLLASFKGSNKRQYYGQRLRMEPAGNVSEGLKTKAEAVKIISSLSCSIVLQLRKLAKGTKYAYKTCYPDWRTSKSTSKLRENLKKKK